MYKQEDYDQFRDLLHILQARLQGDVEQLTDEALHHSDGALESRSPTHLAELGTENFEQDFSLRFVENDQEILQEIDAAFERMESGDFGYCEQCLADGKPRSKSLIFKRRLKAIPYTRYCVECERKREDSNS